MKYPVKIVCSIVLAANAVFAQAALSEGEKPVLDQEFYSALSQKEAIRRDMFLDDNLNKIIAGKGQILSIDANGRYRRRFRIVVNAKVSSAIAITYYVYTDNEEYIRVINQGDTLEFKGQFIIYTPLTTRRNSYIFDVVLEEGAVVVE